MRSKKLLKGVAEESRLNHRHKKGSKITTSDRALRLIDELTLVVNGKEIQFSIREELGLPEEPTEAIMIRHHTRYAFWRKMLSDMAARRRDMQDHLEETMAFVDMGLRELYQKDGSDYTEQSLRSETAVAPKVKAIKEDLRRVLWEEDQCRMMCEAFEHRKAVLMKLKVQ